MAFAKGHKKIGGKKKGSKSAKIKLWEQLKEYICDDGAKKFKKELMALEGKEFIDKYSQILEYFKPKLARTENKTKLEVSGLAGLLEDITQENNNPVNE